MAESEGKMSSTTQGTMTEEKKDPEPVVVKGAEKIIKPADTLEFPDEVYKINIIDIIENTFGFKDYKYTVHAGSSAGDNYIGIVYRIRVTDNVSGEKRCIILKTPPQNAVRRKEFNAKPAFTREILVYDEILKVFQRFQESKGIVVAEEGFHEYPECYRTLSDEPLEGLYFEDLKHSGYDMFSRHLPPTFDHVRLLMEALGKLHAISFAMKDQGVNEMEKYRDLDDIMTQMDSSGQMDSYIQSLQKKALATLDADKNAALIEKLKNIFKRSAMDLTKDCVDGKVVEKYSVVCHGDCWNNNMLYKNENGKAVSIRLLDFQIARYASPVLDLMYYIFACTHKSLRDDHYEEFLQIYHKSLSQYLVRLGSDPFAVFPYEALQSELRRVGRFGLFSAIMLIPIVANTPGNEFDLDEMAEKINKGGEVIIPEMAESTKLIYDTRMRDVILDMERLGYLD